MLCGREEESSPVFGVSGELAAVRQGDHLLGAERHPRQQGDCREGRDGLGTLHLCSIGKTARDRCVLFCCFGRSLYMFAKCRAIRNSSSGVSLQTKKGPGETECLGGVGLSTHTMTYPKYKQKRTFRP